MKEIVKQSIDQMTAKFKTFSSVDDKKLASFQTKFGLPDEFVILDVIEKEMNISGDLKPVICFSVHDVKMNTETTIPVNTLFASKIASNKIIGSGENIQFEASEIKKKDSEYNGRYSVPNSAKVYYFAEGQSMIEFVTNMVGKKLTKTTPKTSDKVANGGDVWVFTSDFTKLGTADMFPTKDNVKNYCKIKSYIPLTIADYTA